MFLRFRGIRSHDLAIGAGDVLFWDRFAKDACTTAMNVLSLLRYQNGDFSRARIGSLHSVCVPTS